MKVIELNFEDEGIEKDAVAIMAARGWRIESSELEFSDAILRGESVEVAVRYSLLFTKNGQPATKEQFDLEMIKVWSDIIQ